MANRVQYREEAEGAVIVRWGDDGREHELAADDDAALRKAWRAAVAEGLSRGESLEDEVDRSVAREIQGEVGIRKDASGGLIIAWWPRGEVADKLEALAATCAYPAGQLAKDDLHLTILYLDDESWAEEGSDWDVDLVAAVCKIFSRNWGPFDARVGGVGRFVGPEAEDEDVLVALVDSERLAHFRDCLKDELLCHGAIPSSSPVFDAQHGFIPHVTLAYVPRTHSVMPKVDEPVEFEVDNITLASGDLRKVFEVGYAGIDYAESDPRPLYAARIATELEKSGRVLSGTNLEAVLAAIATLQAVADKERARAGTDEEILEKRQAFLEEILQGADVEDAALEYVVTKADAERRYTLGPLYAPDRQDAHGEYTDADTLQEAVWQYVRESASEGRRLNLQHGDLGPVTVAEWVEVMSWPYEHTIKVRTAGGEERELSMPAGTVYVGAVWDEDAWPLVKAGKIGGWSLGGKAVRVREGVMVDDLAHMGDKRKAAEKASAARYEDEERLALIRAAAEAEAALRDRELEGARKDSGRLESIVVQLIDAVKSNFSREPGDVHSHLHLEEGAFKDLSRVDVQSGDVRLDVVE